MWEGEEARGMSVGSTVALGGGVSALAIDFSEVWRRCSAGREWDLSQHLEILPSENSEVGGTQGS